MSRMPKYSVAFFLLLALFGCSTRTERALALADSLMMASPDSALRVLNQIPVDSLARPSLRARHTLLTTMAQDKCYMEVTSDSTMRLAYEWFMHHGTEMDRLRAAYYWGVVLENTGDDVQASLRFRQAKDMAARMHEYRWASLADQHLCAAYTRNGDWVRSKDHAQQSLVEAELAHDTLMAGYCRLDLAQEYYVLSRLDSAKILFNQILDSTRDSCLYSFASVSLAKLYLFSPSPDYEKASSLYKTVLEWNVIPFGCQDYGHLALIAEKENNPEQAEKYRVLSEKAMVTAIDSVTYYTILSNIYDLRGDLKRSNDHYGTAIEIQNRVVYKQLEQSITHAIETHYQDEVTLEKEKNRSRFYVVVLVGLLLAAIIVWLSRRLAIARQQLLESMAQIQDFHEDLEHLQFSDTENRYLLDSYLQDRIKTLNALASTYFSWDADSVRQKEKRYGDKTKEDLVVEFQKQLAQFRKDDRLYLGLEQALNTFNDNLMVRARAVLGSANNVDYDLVLLFFSGFSAKSICFLKDMTEAAVRMRKTRLKQAFASLPDGSGDVFVKKLESGGPR